MMRSDLRSRQGDDAWVGAEPNPLFELPSRLNPSSTIRVKTICCTYDGVRHIAPGHGASTGDDQHTLSQPRPWPRAMHPSACVCMLLLCSEDDDKTTLVWKLE